MHCLLFRRNMAYVDADIEMLWEKNIISSLKTTAEVVFLDKLHK